MPLFTRENAAIMSAKGNAARWSPEARAKAKAANNPPPSASVPISLPDDTFAAKRLLRVRAQLDRLDAELAACSLEDSKRVKELTDAQLRLSEQERILDDRPLPGSRRPSADRTSSQVASRPTPRLVQPPTTPPAPQAPPANPA